MNSEDILTLKIIFGYEYARPYVYLPYNHSVYLYLVSKGFRQLSFNDRFLRVYIPEQDVHERLVEELINYKKWLNETYEYRNTNTD